MEKPQNGETGKEERKKKQLRIKSFFPPPHETTQAVSNNNLPTTSPKVCVRQNSTFLLETEMEDTGISPMKHCGEDGTLFLNEEGR